MIFFDYILFISFYLFTSDYKVRYEKLYFEGYYSNFFKIIILFIET